MSRLLFNTIYKGYKKILLPNGAINIKKIDILNHKNQFIQEDSFISNKIKNCIKKYDKCYQINISDNFNKLSYPYESNKYMPKITVYYLDNKLVKDIDIKKKIKPSLNRIYFISNIYSKYSKDNTPLYCWLCPVKNKKLIPINTQAKHLQSVEIIGPNNVNSGLSIPDLRHIKIWRDEELNKVLVHELIHSYKLDKSIYEYDNTNNHIRNNINIDKYTDINVNEAYTETLSVILNSIFILVDKEKYNSKSKRKTKRNTNTYSYKQFQDILSDEIDFSLLQSAKVLKYNGYNNINELFDFNDNFWKQKTNVLSYYIIKSALLFSLDDFIKFLKTTNRLIVDKSNINDFNKLLVRSLKNKKYIKQVNHYIKTLKNKNIEDTSLRMTVYG